jgi:hypothetical protein
MTAGQRSSSAATIYVALYRKAYAQIKTPQSVEGTHAALPARSPLREARTRNSTCGDRNPWNFQEPPAQVGRLTAYGENRV